MFNLYKNNNQLNSFKVINSNQEFIFIYNFFKTLSFIQIYNFFKIIEIKFQLSGLCLNNLNIIFNLNITKKDFKKFFLLNGLFFLKKNFLKKNFLEFLKNFLSYYKDVKFFKKILRLNNFYMVGEVYKNYKGSIIPFNISKLSWFVRLGLKTEEN